MTSPSHQHPSGNPFADHVGFTLEPAEPGHSTGRLRIEPHHLNPNGVLHGAALYAMADTGMGAAVFPTLAPGELCATIEIKINYFKPVHGGLLTCRTTLVNRGKAVANLDARLYLGEVLVAQANGNYAIFTPKPKAASA